MEHRSDTDDGRSVVFIDGIGMFGQREKKSEKLVTNNDVWDLYANIVTIV